MIKLENDEIEIQGNPVELIAETCGLLGVLKEALTQRYGEEEAVKDMDYILTHYDMSEEELEAQTKEAAVKEVLSMIFK